MATDINSSLPIRSEADGADAKVLVKLVDGTVGGSNQMSIDADKNAHVEVHGNNPAGGDEVLRLSELGALTPDGVYDVANNTKPGNLGLIASVRDAAPSDTTQTQRLTAVTNSDVRALDVAIRDENGAAFTTSNPLPVTLVDSEGDEINSFDDAANVAIGASVNHDYTVTALKTMKLAQINATASGKIKIEVQVETAPLSGTFTTKFVAFNSTANPNITLDIKELISVAAGVIIRVVKTNRDLAIQDIYSTISGHEI